MNIGIMLRHYDQHGGGVRVYTHNLLRTMLAMETPHEFTLAYRDPARVGTYAGMKGTKEISVRTPTIPIPGGNVLGKRLGDLLWDQVAMPKVARQESIDLIFNPKFSVPLRAKCPSVFVCHGLDVFVRPEGARWFDRMNYHQLMPRYAKRASRIIAVSDITREHAIRFLGVPEDKVHTVHLGVHEAFGQPVTEEQLSSARERFSLPERYFLFVGQIYPPKNFGRLVEAFARVGPEHGISLVVAGAHTKTKLCADEIAKIDELGLSKWVHQLGWIEHQDLPPLYRMAESLVMPSLYEACPSPPLEAMSSGCPVVTANRYGTKEVAGDAAILVDPEDVEHIADGMRRIVTSNGARDELIAAGHRRAAEFTWEKCARRTMEVLELARA